MKKSELDLIEIYVFANHVQGLSSCVKLQNFKNNNFFNQFGKFTENLSQNMIKTCEKKLKKKKLSSLSFLILKKELTNFKFYTNEEKNLTALCMLLNKFNFYNQLLATN